REEHRHGSLDTPLTRLLAVDIERDRAALAESSTVVVKLDAHLMRTGRNLLLALGVEALETEQVVAVLRPAVLDVEAPARKRAALRHDHALGTTLRHCERGGHGVRLVLDVDHRILGQPSHAAEEQL